MSEGGDVRTGILVDPEMPVRFTFDGKSVRALQGQSIAAALYASGVRIFSRSFKDHRPRGLFCMSGDCPNCLMRVDGRDNVRTCVEPARDGQKVVHQHAWPSLNFDVSWLFEHFMKSRRGWLDATSLPAPVGTDQDVEELTAEVCVVGGGPAGLAAATEAGAAGAQVLVIERLSRLGGHLLYSGSELGELDPFIDALRTNPKVRLLTDTTVFDLSKDLQVGAYQGNRFLKVRASQVIVCTGGRERPYTFHNNDLPGIFLCRALQRLGRLYGVAPGRKAVLLTDRDDGPSIADELFAYGVEVKAVLDPRSAKYGTRIGRGWSQKLVAGETMLSGTPTGWQLMMQHVLLEAQGSSHLTGVKVAQINPSGSIVAKSIREIECDLLCIASSLTPANELLLQAGLRYQKKDGRWQPARPQAGLSAAGAAAGTFDILAQVTEGKLRGAEAAAALGHDVPALEQHRADWNSAQPQAAQAAQEEPLGTLMPYVDENATQRYVCLCADVTQFQFELALAQGCENLDAVKGYAKVTRGPCQGKVCEPACVELCTRWASGEGAEATPGKP